MSAEIYSIKNYIFKKLEYLLNLFLYVFYLQKAEVMAYSILNNWSIY
jgi:hypothetical protein